MPDRGEARDEVAWVLFDGRCNLCDGWVGWLLARDRGRRLRFGTLEGETAAALRRRHPALPAEDESVLLVERPGTPAEGVGARSDAVIGILRRLGGRWRALAGLLRAVPTPLRDAAYRFVARRRGRWFGRRSGCRVPAPEERERFLA